MLLIALAVLLWPTRDPYRRLQPKERGKVVVPKAIPVLVATAAAWWFAGAGGVLAALLVGATLLHKSRTRAAQRKTQKDTEALAYGIRGVVDELKAGAHPAAAAEAAARDCATPQVFKAIAGTARLGGEVDHPEQLARAWRISTRHGVALAEVLDAVRRDLEQRLAFGRLLDARMAGPRTSAAVLAALPAFGLLIGQASGAHPLHVLAETLPGQVLLVMGALLTCAGLLWTDRLTRAAP